MNYSLSLQKPLKNTFFSNESSFIKQALLLLVGVVVLAAAAQLYVPLKPVPLTFQSTTVILIGMAYGPRLGFGVVVSYLIAGLCGLPVFEAFSSGLSTLLGPTSGYLIGFLGAATLSGYLAEKGWAKNIFTSFFAALLGTLLLFACGVTGLALSIGWHNAIHFGVLPFLISEPAKLIAVSCLIPRCWKRSSHDN